MGTFLTALRFWQGINLVELTKNAMEENHDGIVELNREQLDAGAKSDGTFLPPYAYTTQQDKKAKGKEYSIMNLQDTNAFRSKFYLSISGDKYSINSSDDKTTLLTDKYSTSIFGLTDYNKYQAWVQFLRSSVIRQIKAKLR